MRKSFFYAAFHDAILSKKVYLYSKIGSVPDALYCKCEVKFLSPMEKLHIDMNRSRRGIVIFFNFSVFPYYTQIILSNSIFKGNWIFIE